MTGQESLELITRMITKAKKDYYDTGLSALLWGSVITFCAGVTFANYWLQWPYLDYVWFLTIIAVIPQVMIGIREAKARKYRAFEEDHMGGIWISFAIAIFLLSYFLNRFPGPQDGAIYLTLYGVPTFATGYTRRFRPMIYGGLACWVFAILSTLTKAPYTILFIAGAAQLAWFIPGLILRKCYLKAKETHVQRS